MTLDHADRTGSARDRLRGADSAVDEQRSVLARAPLESERLLGELTILLDPVNRRLAKRVRML
jgi:hypothetical protein